MFILCISVGLFIKYSNVCSKILLLYRIALTVYRRHCDVALSKNINPSLVLVQPRKTCPFIAERLLTGCKESNKTNCLPASRPLVKSVYQKNTYVVGTQKNRHNKKVLFSTQNIY